MESKADMKKRGMRSPDLADALILVGIIDLWPENGAEFMTGFIVQQSSEANRATNAKEAIAYHEAGHAVISMKLGYKCLYVTIIADGDRLGHVCCEDPLAGGHGDRIKHALKVLIAASLAESKHIGSRTWGDADDRVKATNLALSATDRDTEQAEALINKIIGEARKLGRDLHASCRWQIGSCGPRPGPRTQIVAVVTTYHLAAGRAVVERKPHDPGQFDN